MTTCTVDGIAECFLNPVIAKNNNEPTHTTIDTVEKKLIMSAASVQSELGGGNAQILIPSK